MANSLTTNPIYIDVFSAAIDLADYLAPEVHLSSIEWTQPTTAGHYATIFSGGATGVTMFHVECTATSQTFIKYYHGASLRPPYIPVAAGNLLASGKIIITIQK